MAETTNQITAVVSVVKIREIDVVQVPIEDGERDEACEPEEHGEGIEDKVAYGVGERGGEFGDEDEEEDD